MRYSPPPIAICCSCMHNQSVGAPRTCPAGRQGRTGALCYLERACEEAPPPRRAARRHAAERSMHFVKRNSAFKLHHSSFFYCPNKRKRRRRRRFRLPPPPPALPSSLPRPSPFLRKRQSDDVKVKFGKRRQRRRRRRRRRFCSLREPADGRCILMPC